MPYRSGPYISGLNNGSVTLRAGKCGIFFPLYQKYMPGGLRSEGIGLKTEGGGRRTENKDQGAVRDRGGRRGGPLCPPHRVKGYREGIE